MKLNSPFKVTKTTRQRMYNARNFLKKLLKKLPFLEEGEQRIVLKQCEYVLVKNRVLNQKQYDTLSKIYWKFRTTWKEKRNSILIQKNILELPNKEERSEKLDLNTQLDLIEEILN